MNFKKISLRDLEIFSIFLIDFFIMLTGIYFITSVFGIVAGLNEIKIIFLVVLGSIAMIILKNLMINLIIKERQNKKWKK